MPTAFFQSSIRPTPPIAGVGRMAGRAAVLGPRSDLSRCRARRCRRRSGNRAPAGVGHAVDAADELAHDLGALGVAEVHAVGGGERPGADRAEVAPGLGDRLPAAFDRIGEAIARRAIGGDRERLLGAVDADQGGVAAGRLERVGADLLVVLPPDPAARGEVGRGHQRQQIGGDVGAFGRVGERRGGSVFVHGRS